jgi:hypothetical protein
VVGRCQPSCNHHRFTPTRDWVVHIGWAVGCGPRKRTTTQHHSSVLLLCARQARNTGVTRATPTDHITHPAGQSTRGVCTFVTRPLALPACVSLCSQCEVDCPTSKWVQEKLSFVPSVDQHQASAEFDPPFRVTLLASMCSATVWLAVVDVAHDSMHHASSDYPVVHMLARTHPLLPSPTLITTLITHTCPLRDSRERTVSGRWLAASSAITFAQRSGR